LGLSCGTRGLGSSQQASSQYEDKQYTCGCAAISHIAPVLTEWDVFTLMPQGHSPRAHGSLSDVICGGAVGRETDGAVG